MDFRVSGSIASQLFSRLCYQNYALGGVLLDKNHKNSDETTSRYVDLHCVLKNVPKAILVNFRSNLEMKVFQTVTYIRSYH